MARIEVQSLVPIQAPSLADLEAQSVEYPWTAEQYAESLRAGCPGWALVVDDVLVGFALFSVVQDEASLLNTAIAKASQRQGLGRQLLQRALAVLREEKGVKRCLLEVRRSNLGAQALYTALGFSVLATRRDYYRTRMGREDAVIMHCLLDEASHGG